MAVINVSLLTPRATASGVTIVAYDSVADSFATIQPSALTGQTGAQGPAGPTGPQGPQGVPGSAGTNGKTVLNGTGAPIAANGTNGDFYYDTQNKMFYGPKSNGAWPAGFSIVGPTGPQGPQGPAGADGGGGGGTSNVDNGTVNGQFPVWDQTAGKYVPQTGVSITGDRTPTVELNASTALTFLNHNRRNIVQAALAPLTLAASEVGTSPNQGFEATVQTDHTAVNTITFGSGITVKQPSTGTGTSGQVKIAVDGVISVQIYPKGSGLIAKVRGDVA